MSISDPKFIDEDSAELARLYRLLKAEDERIAGFEREMRTLPEPRMLQNWIFARQLRRRLHQGIIEKLLALPLCSLY